MSRNGLPPPEPARERRSIRRAWLSTATVAAMVGVMLLFAAHGKLTSIAGMDGIANIAGAGAAAVYARRRGETVYDALASGRPVPTSTMALTLAAVLAVTTCIAAAATLVIGW